MLCFALWLIFCNDWWILSWVSFTGYHLTCVDTFTRHNTMWYKQPLCIHVLKCDESLWRCKRKVCYPSDSLEASGRWAPTTEQPSACPGFFRTILHINASPKDTFIKLPVSTASNRGSRTVALSALRLREKSPQSISCEAHMLPNILVVTAGLCW